MTCRPVLSTTERISPRRVRFPSSFVLFALFLPLLVGCRGCQSSNAARESETNQAIKTDPYLSETIRTLPSSLEQPLVIKPSHWLSASQRLKSTQDDVRGEFSAQLSTIEESGNLNLKSTRPIVLPRGQWREINFRLLPKQAALQGRTSFQLSSRISESGKVLEFPKMQQRIQAKQVLDPQEYLFVILTTRPERFTRFRASDWVDFRPAEFQVDDSRPNFRIVTVSDQESVAALPETMIDWTATAIVLWDDLPPDRINPQQLKAMEDWLRFGGTLILNGATPTESLSFTTLSRSLPIRLETAVELDIEDASELLRQWSVSSDTSLEKQIALVNQSAGISFVGRQNSNANVVAGSAGLLATMRVGRGKVVQTRFDLTGEWISNWGSYDSFVNSVILSRPRRQVLIREDEIGDRWASQRYPDYELKTADPAFNTRVRIASRDFHMTGPVVSTSNQGHGQSYLDPLTEVDPKSGIAGWREGSHFIELASKVLRKESGIRIPRSRFAMLAIMIYLILLIPMNYVVCRLLSHLEWFWAATILISLLGAIVIARMTQLDIGFDRSQNELALLEVHSDYERGHLTRLLTIYNSLSTSYQIEFDSRDVAVEPFQVQDQFQESETPSLDLTRSANPTLSGFHVRSNQSRMLRVEQVVELGGSVSLSPKNEIHNQTSLTFSDTVVIRKTLDGRYEKADLGLLKTGERRVIQFDETDDLQPNANVSMGLSSVLESLKDSNLIPPGSVRMVALHQGVIEGLKAMPAVDQAIGHTVVLVHLRYPSEPKPQADMNLVSDFRKTLGKDDNAATKGNSVDGSVDND